MKRSDVIFMGGHYSPAGWERWRYITDTGWIKVQVLSLPSIHETSRGCNAVWCPLRFLLAALAPGSLPYQMQLAHPVTWWQRPQDRHTLAVTSHRRQQKAAGSPYHDGSKWISEWVALSGSRGQCLKIFSAKPSKLVSLLQSRFTLQFGIFNIVKLAWSSLPINNTS